MIRTFYIWRGLNICGNFFFRPLVFSTERCRYTLWFRGWTPKFKVPSQKAHFIAETLDSAKLRWSYRYLQIYNTYTAIRAKVSVATPFLASGNACHSLCKAKADWHFLSWQRGKVALRGKRPDVYKGGLLEGYNPTSAMNPQNPIYQLSITSFRAKMFRRSFSRVKWIAGMIILLYGFYEKICKPPRHLRHLAYNNIFISSWKMITGVPTRMISRSLALPLMVQNPQISMFCRLERFGWTVHIVHPECAKKVLTSPSKKRSAFIFKRRHTPPDFSDFFPMFTFLLRWLPQTHWYWFCWYTSWQVLGRSQCHVLRRRSLESTQNGKCVE